MTKGKWYEEFVGMLETITSTILYVMACMYGSDILTILIYIPLSIFGMINLNKNENNSIVQLNKMTIKRSFIMVLFITVSITILSFLLSIIPTQKLPFWDAAGDILNICGILLIALRYKEGWLIWIICNLVEIITWVIALAKNYSENAIMMIIMSLIYIALNIWGVHFLYKN